MDSLSHLAELTAGRLRGADARFVAVSTDTRSLQPGEVFFALRGPRFDAAAFVAEAAAGGAVGAVVEQPVAAAISQVEVADTRQALAVYAAHWRRLMATPVIGITGSNGKTTVKELCAGIMRMHWPQDAPSQVLATAGNLNNEIGVPLTLLRLRPEHRVAVVEMGASKPGDIAFLAGLARPQVAILTSIGRAHIETMGGIDGVARTKGELLDGLEAAATAVLNKDSAYFPELCDRAKPATVVSFGSMPDADFFATDVQPEIQAGQPGFRFTMHTPAGAHAMRLPLAGRHNVQNALAAAAATLAAGATIADVARGLASARNVAGRLRMCTLASGAILYDDSYNANPDSVAAAIDALRSVAGDTLLVLGDMGELGAEAEELHAAIGRHARAAGAARLYCTGQLSRATAAAFGDGAEWFAELDDLRAALLPELTDGRHVLVKASRFMGLDRLVAALTADSEGG
ncbi:MAG: UDP-N-acetylmuramoyl-tripeptide--D-alanyl-D-alanine ligase [Gammaproteobacteria bacterium]|nr:UDP-N-acetylmuramoyl-tripeptide--D-alanyl-D-alanine ligase [Gammaproteobacteria bacterium]